MDEKIQNTCNELLVVCMKNNLSISDMFEVSRVFPKTVKQHINTLEHNTAFKANFDSDIQE